MRPPRLAARHALAARSALAARFARGAAAFALATALVAACRRSSAPSGSSGADAGPAPQALGAGASSVVPAGDGSARPARATRKASGAGRAGERVVVKGGTLHAGSLPGDEGRDPKLEPPGTEVALGPFEIDRLPYPNDPAAPPRTGVSRDDASRLCQERGERLCTELEWELACKGEDDDPYAAGDAWDPACARDANACASSLGVLAMGALREWTASDLLPSDRGEKARPAVRGAAPSGEPLDHRCAHRTGAERTERAGDLGFRCCAGTPNAATVPAAKPGPIVRKVTLEAEQVAEMLGAVPQLASLQDGLRFYAEPDDVATVHKRGQRADLEGWTLTASPLVWNPVAGDEVLVLLARAKKDAVVAAFWRLPGDRYRLASSMVFQDETGPFALAYHGSIREKLLWSSCWRCPGEQGAIVLREGKRVVVVQQ